MKRILWRWWDCLTVIGVILTAITALPLVLWVMLTEAVHDMRREEDVE